ncbi:MAG: hypothetical protein Ct9H300mP19_12370 [Dehalococcoidia bacterium]|nr:MAG: hypothetical protein Ct9H300mP19_12370 [Dehalococcoidia bacterium]
MIRYLRPPSTKCSSVRIQTLARQGSNNSIQNSATRTLHHGICHRHRAYGNDQLSDSRYYSVSPLASPSHRGPSSINWPIINGESTTGLTIFWPDNGLDTGPVLMQKTVEITTKETLGDLYFKKLFPLGVEAIIESVELVRPEKHQK